MRTAVTIRDWFGGLFTDDPWTDVYALGRSLVALSPLLTLVFNPTRVLFADGPGIEPLSCDGLIGAVGLFCVVPSLEVARYLGIAVLAVAVVGWLPRWFALPHAWVAVSLHNAMSVVEGGDQLAGNLALLLLPVALLDGRRWHWRAAGGDNRGFGNGETGRMIANSSMVLVRLQVCVVYLHAALGKLVVPEWLDGTAIYYWASEPLFGPAGIRGSLFGELVGTAPGVMVLTWGTIVLEFALAFGLIAGYPVRRGLFWLALVFHLGIAAMFGLVTFGVSMAGAVLLYLWPRADPPSLPDRVAGGMRRWRERFQPAVDSDGSGPAESSRPPSTCR